MTMKEMRMLGHILINRFGGYVPIFLCKFG